MVSGSVVVSRCEKAFSGTAFAGVEVESGIGQLQPPPGGYSAVAGGVSVAIDGV